MADFINTVDVIGDDALTDSIITKAITEYCDDTTTTIGGYALYKCAALTSVNCPAVTSIGTHALCKCSELTIADFSADVSISINAFRDCSKLTTLILRNTTKVATLTDKYAPSNTPIESGTGYIYVPRALVDSYKSATNWSTYATQIRAIEDYPDICGG